MIYAVSNQKGGSGKTSTSLCLWAGLTHKKGKSLLIDLDAQSNSSYVAGAKTDGITILDVLNGTAAATDAIQETIAGDIIPASPDLADKKKAKDIKPASLWNALAPIKGMYDYIVLDCPPTLGPMTIAALTAADKVIVVTQADIFGLQGLDQMGQTIEAVKKNANPKLQIEGVLLTRHNSRTNLAQQVTALADQLAQKLGTKLFHSTIRESVIVKESQILQQDLFTYAPKAKVTQDYASFISELIEGSI